MFLTRDEVEQLDYKACKLARKRLEEAYPFDTPIEELDKQVWDDADEAINTLLYLEDRIKLFDDPRITSMSTEEL
jgi:hypothetical protein